MKLQISEILNHVQGWLPNFLDVADPLWPYVKQILSFYVWWLALYSSHKHIVIRYD